MNISINGCDCAEKEVQRQELEAAMAAYVAKKGKVTVLPGFAPKPRPVLPPSKPEPRKPSGRSERARENRNAVYKQVQAGMRTPVEIAMGSGLGEVAVIKILGQLQRQRLVRCEGESGAVYTWFPMERAE